MYHPIQPNLTFDKSFNYTEYMPDPRLRPFIQCFWSTNRFHKLATNEEVTVLPDGCIDVIFESERVDSVKGILFGGINTPIQTVPQAYEHIIGMRFRPAGAFIFVKDNLATFQHTSILMNDIFEKESYNLEEKIKVQNNIKTKISVLEEWLLKQYERKQSDYDQSILNSLHDIYITNGNIPVQELARKEVMSARSFQRLFNQWVGYSPKQFTRIVRFQSAIQDLVKNPTLEGVEIALKYNYHDQAHFIRDFKSYTGHTPKSFSKTLLKLSDFYNQ